VRIPERAALSALDQLLVKALPWVPKPLVSRVSSRYIAGESLPEALRHIDRLNARGFLVTVDILGEFVADKSAVEAATLAYLEIFDVLAQRQLQSQASVKLSQLGLKLDRQLCEASIRQLVQRAAATDNLVTIDMEDSSCTDETLRIFELMRRESACVGAVIQARLRRSLQDVERLLPLTPHVRICKGIYIEPEAIAWRDFDEIRAAYLQLLECMLAQPSFVAIATHDAYLVDQALRMIHERKIGRDRYEFQLLLGVREDLGGRLLDEGHPVRIYVPFGREWYAYSMRRLQENPAIAGHVFRQFFGAK
jgi:proline dehydrogenase